MNLPPKFDSEELNLLTDRKFLLAKRRIQEKITELLENLQADLANRCMEKLLVDLSTVINPPKISKGENYKGLPYHVLDYPAIFQNEDILAFRTMFYWGNFFSATIHLQGKFLDQNRQVLQDNLSKLTETNCYICVNDNPWEYTYTKDNYELLSLEHFGKIRKDSFIKLSKKMALEDYINLNNTVSDFYFALLPHLNYE
jgi:hypothetical protein